MKKYLVILVFVIFHLLVGMRIVSAGETFQNNLLKVDLYESSLGGVKMTLYTNKPYNDSVMVNKKSDSEYVILMPETSNSLTAKPSLRSVSNAVKNVEVKTQQYSGQIKGYTKIVVTTAKPIEIMPQVQVLSGAPQISEKEYNELLAQSAKKNIGKAVTKPAQTTVKAPAKATAKSAAKIPAKPPVYVQKPRESVKTIISETKATATKTVSKKPVSVQKTVQQKVVNAPKVVKETSKKAEAHVTKKAEAPAVKKAEVPKKETALITPVAKVPVAKTATEETSKTQDVVTPAATSEPQTQVVKPEEKVGPAPAATTAQQTPVASNSTMKEISKLQVYKHMIKNQIKATLKKNNIYTLAGMALIPIILLLLVLRVIGKSVSKMKAQKSSFMANLKEKPVKTTDIAGKITDDMNWKEKFKTYTEATKERAQEHAAPDNMQESPELDDLFGEEEFPHIEDESRVSPEAAQEENFYGEVPAESAQAESAQDYEDPSADIYREVDAYYDNQSVSNEAGEESFAQAGTYAAETSALDQFGSTMGQEISEEDISLDELFGADEEEIASRSEESFGYAVNPLIEEPVAVQKDFQVEFSDDFSFDTALMEDENEIVEGLTEELTEKSGKEIVTSEFVIDNNKGFYLVDFEDTTALVGHIADEIFVLKKFDKKIEGNLQARMDERKENSINYMTKVGKFKALVEVTPKNMNLLIEL